MGGNDYPEPPAEVERNIPEGGEMMQFLGPLLGSMTEMMGANMEMMGQMSEMQAMAALPSMVKPPEVDWTERINELSQKMKAEYSLDNARRHGRMQTVHSSPLLDDESPDLTGTLLK